MCDGKTTTVRKVFTHSSMQDDYESFEPERSTVKKQKIEQCHGKLFVHQLRTYIATI